ncbi:MAG TPA: PDZ domain-containing protein [Candidatus Dormibacteraeota bacterium]|nr:PDZ domain-containing protein [Candidatus Dormibacteraeota bacterium]
MRRAYILTKSHTKSGISSRRSRRAVQDVMRGGPADKAGLKPGDVIRKIDGRPVNGADELTALVANTNPGTSVTLDVLRNGQPLTLKLTMEQRPTDLGLAMGVHKTPSEGPLRGVFVQNLTPALRKQLAIPADAHGVVVTEIDPSSPAAQHLEQGDVIVSVDHQPVTSVADVNKLAAAAKSKALLRIIYQGEGVFIVISSDNK